MRAGLHALDFERETLLAIGLSKAVDHRLVEIVEPGRRLPTTAPVRIEERHFVATPVARLPEVDAGLALHLRSSPV